LEKRGSNKSLLEPSNRKRTEARQEGSQYPENKEQRSTGKCIARQKVLTDRHHAEHEQRPELFARLAIEIDEQILAIW